MEFDDLKIIWNEQKAEKLYAFNEEGLKKQVIQQATSTKRAMDFSDLTVICIFLSTSLALAVEPVFYGTAQHKLYGSFIWAAVAIGAWIRRFKYYKGANSFDESITSVLDDAIKRIHHHIRFSKTMILWVGIPYIVFVFINAYFQNSYESIWLFASMFIPLPLMYLVVDYGIKKTEIPRLNKFENLRNKFSDTE